MPREHHYQATIRWTGNLGSGTSDYSAYGRDHRITITDKADIHGSADPAFRGDPSRHNPEELLLAALSGCHMLWYLHLCADAGIIVTEYQDNATAVMAEESHGGGRFREAMLHPQVTIEAAADYEKAMALHEAAHRHCFIANSVNFPVRHQPLIRIGGQDLP